MQQNNFNTAKLKQIGGGSDTASNILSKLADRERNRDFVDLARLRREMKREGNVIVDEDYKEFWQQLEKEKAGKVTFGRRGKLTRFDLYCNLIPLVKVLMGESIETSELTKIGTAHVETPKKRGRPRKEAKTAMSHSERVVLVLNGDKIISIEMPRNLTKQEIESVSKAVRGFAYNN